MNKILTKRCFRNLGINTPPEFLFQPKRQDDWKKLLVDLDNIALQYPLILKPVKGGSSAGIQLARNRDDVTDFLENTYDGTPYFFEEFVQGEEYCVGIFATRSSTSPIVLPLARINHEGEWKWNRMRRRSIFVRYLDSILVQSADYVFTVIFVNGFEHVGFHSRTFQSGAVNEMS